MTGAEDFRDCPAGLRIVLSGGMGSGKSTVARMLQGCGAALFDADAVSRELTAPEGAALASIAAAFGQQALDAQGALDRARMRALVFSRPDARRQLESILHPLIAARAQEIDRDAGAAPLVFDIPLLSAQSPWRRRARRVLVIDCSELTQIRRVQDRSGLQEGEIRRVMDSQISRHERRALADAVIHNEGLSMAQLQQEVEVLWRHWLTRG